MQAHANHTRFWAMMHLRCPRCLEGPIFSGRFRMNEQCPLCGLRFMREPGYFVGAMFISYGMSVGFTWVAIAILWWNYMRDWPILVPVLVGTLLLLPFVSIIFRYSRALWMHFDWFVDPGPPMKK